MTKRDPARKDFDGIFRLLAEGAWRFEHWRSALRDGLSRMPTTPDFAPMMIRILDSRSAEQATQKPRRPGAPKLTEEERQRRDDERAVKRLRVEIVETAIHRGKRNPKSLETADPFQISSMAPVLQPYLEKTIPPLLDATKAATKEYAGRHWRVDRGAVRLAVLAGRVLESKGGKLSSPKVGKSHWERVRKPRKPVGK
jgi:hypothetical protein